MVDFYIRLADDCRENGVPNDEGNIQESAADDLDEHTDENG